MKVYEELTTCCLCGRCFDGPGENPQPLAGCEESCCHECNYRKVIPARVRQLENRETTQTGE